MALYIARDNWVAYDKGLHLFSISCKKICWIWVTGGRGIFKSRDQLQGEKWCKPVKPVTQRARAARKSTLLLGRQPLYVLQTRMSPWSWSRDCLRNVVREPSVMCCFYVEQVHWGTFGLHFLCFTLYRFWSTLCHIICRVIADCGSQPAFHKVALCIFLGLKLLHRSFRCKNSVLHLKFVFKIDELVWCSHSFCIV